jgi:hypothetical protein
MGIAYRIQLRRGKEETENELTFPR